MIFINILIIIVATAISSFVSSFNKTNDSNISSFLFFKNRVYIVFIYAGALIFNALYIQSIGSGIGLYDNIGLTFSMKDIVTIQIPITTVTPDSLCFAVHHYNIDSLSFSSNNPDISHSFNFLLLFLNKINKIIPDWIKLAFKIWIFTILVIKLLGFSVLEVYFNKEYFRVYCYITCSLIIFYQLFNLYLLHIFTTREVKIPEILPDFILNRLKGNFVGLNTDKDKEWIRYLKNMYYTEILIYTVLLILMILTR